MNMAKLYAMGAIVQVWHGAYADYVVPRTVMLQALQFTKFERLNDRRTKGSKLIAKWASLQEAMSAAFLMLSQSK